MHPLVAIVGTTGTGKSDLAISLVKTLQSSLGKSCVLINADIMQTYKGLDIATNKHVAETPEEVHELMNIKDPHEEYTVSKYVKDARRIIEKAHTANKIPVLVGGSHYYIRSLIFNNSLVSEEEEEEGDSIANNDDATAQVIHPSLGDNYKQSSLLQSFLNQTRSSVYNNIPKADRTTISNQMHDLLKEIDPVMASKWHPNNVRKIRRSLQVYFNTGRKHSDIINGRDGLETRYNTLALWLHADLDVLDKRLDSRVDKMIEKGLVSELLEMRRQCLEGSVLGTTKPANTGTQNSEMSPEYTRGILQAIGFKEFHDYLNLYSVKPETPKQKELFSKGVESLKLATRQYARRQIKYLRNKLFGEIVKLNNNNNSHNYTSARSYVLDATSLDEWNLNVRDKAVDLVKAFVSEGDEMPNPESISEKYTKLVGSIVSSQEWKTFTCDICKVKTFETDDDGSKSQEPKFRTFYGEKEWNIHLKSSHHRKSKRKLVQIQEWSKRQKNCLEKNFF